MKKLALITLLFLFVSLELKAQGEANNWYFGGKAGISFNTGSPVALTDGELETLEGCATISDSSGQLLFYTDGITVWDKSHNVMLNGTGLLGDSSSTQSAIIIPKPNAPNIYYIFTVDNNAQSNGVQYSEVDITLNNGNGAITGVKNVSLLSQTTEKITAIQNANGTDIWVMVHGWNNASFYAYNVTSMGVEASPVVTTVGSVHGGDTSNTIGYMKFSPDGSRLALAKTYNTNFVEIFDFDNATGTLSNPFLLEGIFYSDAGVYGLEFSLDSQILYVSDLNFSLNKSKIHQFNISLMSSTDIMNSDVVLYEGDELIGALQLAIDGKIYSARGSMASLGAIELPNTLGTGANYMSDAVTLSSGNSTFGLPPFIQSFFAVGIKTENNCFGDVTDFSIATNATIDSINWDFGDGSISDLETPSHQYLVPGSYTVSVTVVSGTETKVTTKVVIINDVPVSQAISDFILCDDTSNNGVEIFNLSTKDTEALGGQDATVYGVAYFNTQLEAQQHTNVLLVNYPSTSNNQEIFAKVYNIQNRECYAITPFNLIVNVLPVANSITDKTFCDDSSNDGIEVIDLTLFNSDVLLSQASSSFTITYHLSQSNANNNVVDIVDPLNFQISTTSQTVYVRIENNLNTSCYNTTQFDIVLFSYIVLNHVDDFYLCDDISNDGKEFFDLSLQDAQIIGGQTGIYNITYHHSLSDAVSNNLPITGLYENLTNTEEIFYRKEENSNAYCYQVSSFHIGVLKKPEIEDKEVQNICSNETKKLIADPGYDEYLWSTGEKTQEIVVNSAGTYDVTVTRYYNVVPFSKCSATKSIEVVESDEAVLIDVNTVDWSAGENTITVFVTGIGDYEYSLDGYNYQDSNAFYNLSSKEYTVYIRDKNGCGVITKEVFLLFYPFYFTPNGDSYNDYWQIEFSETEPDMVIYIFDRFGKLLKEITPKSKGWDGNYNGLPMPTSDYWFVVKRPKTGQEYKGHFTLKR